MAVALANGVASVEPAVNFGQPAIGAPSGWTGATFDVSDGRMMSGRRSPETSAIAGKVMNGNPIGGAGEAEAAQQRARLAQLDPVHDRYRLARSSSEARLSRSVADPALGPVSYAVRNARVLARGALRAVDQVPPAVIEALRSSRVRAAASPPTSPAPMSRRSPASSAIRAAAETAAALDEQGNLSAIAIVSQIRSIAMDLLRARGEEPADVRAAVREASTP